MKAPHCLGCGYCLYGVYERCPECGRPIVYGEYKAFLRRRALVLKLVWGTTVPMIWLGCMALPIIIGKNLYYQQIMGDEEGRDLIYWMLMVVLPAACMLIVPLLSRWVVYRIGLAGAAGLTRPRLGIAAVLAVGLPAALILWWSLLVAME